VDNVSEVVDGKIKIIDYKNSRKPKREEWVIDYYLQASAYFIAYWDMSGKKADGAEIWIANEVDNLPQKFTLTQSDLQFYAKEFIKRRQMFQDKFNI
jgi:genome maintenance exonuclease 1